MNRSKLLLISSVISAVTGIGLLILAGILIGIMLTSSSPGAITIPSYSRSESRMSQEVQNKTSFENTRGMWLWDQNVVLNVDEQDNLFIFAADKGITDLYVNAFSLVREDPESLRRFIGRASQQGIRVELLAGDPNWAKEANHFIPLAFLRDTIAFAQSSSPEQRPIGVQFDIEPYVLGRNWPVPEYLALLELLMQEARGSEMSVTVAIPFWFDIDELQQSYNGQVLPLSNHVISIVDRVVIMDYRDFAEGKDGLITNAETEMAFAATLNKPVIIGVETQCNLDEPPKVTFCEEGETFLNREMDKVKAAYGEGLSWGGVAIHRYSSYRDIIPYACPEDGGLTIVDPPDGYHTSSRFISVQGCSSTREEPIQVYVDLDDGPHLQDMTALPGKDGRWKVDGVVLGGTPLPCDHSIYAVTKQPKDGTEIRSDKIVVVKDES